LDGATPWLTRLLLRFSADDGFELGWRVVGIGGSCGGQQGPSHFAAARHHG
jgi:hypothetical protein